MTFERLVLFSDGGSRRRKISYAAAAALITDGETVVAEKGWFLGDITNNQAEYSGLLRGIDLALELGTRELICISDSQLMIRQLNGDYRVKNKNLKLLFEQVKGREKEFSSVLYIHVPREHEMIQRADELVNKVLDSHMGK